ncbi:hypothetical protein [Bryobacter aggregatus]|uniref:hypothetical protein n=1 Tax=Bryobacter aggregatus TaxID=360054 RepID=UPI0004E1A33A|nr:hypothetical protein [Bryobacter aggregatus]
MKLQYEKNIASAAMPGIAFQIRRISLAQRLRFLAENYGLMQRLKFLNAGVGQEPQERSAAAELEIDLSRRLLEAALISTTEAGCTRPADESLIQWLLEEAPTELSVEVLAHIGDEMVLSDPRRKN